MIKDDQVHKLPKTNSAAGFTVTVLQKLFEVTLVQCVQFSAS